MGLDMLKKILSFTFLTAVLCAFTLPDGLKGKWEYAGGLYNGKLQSASTEYTLQRKYNDAQYEASFIEKGEKPIIYEQGKYELNQDTCLETQTFSAQPTKLLNVTLRYRYQIKNDTLTLNGVLPNGTVVQEYWKKVK